MRIYHPKYDRHTECGPASFAASYQPKGWVEVPDLAEAADVEASDPPAARAPKAEWVEYIAGLDTGHAIKDLEAMTIPELQALVEA